MKYQLVLQFAAASMEWLAAKVGHVAVLKAEA
jgi:hypothetical protein